MARVACRFNHAEYFYFQNKIYYSMHTHMRFFLLLIRQPDRNNVEIYYILAAQANENTLQMHSCGCIEQRPIYLLNATLATMKNIQCDP